MLVVSWLLIGNGFLLVLTGTLILALSALQLLRQMGLHGTTPNAAPPAAPGVSLGDLSKLLEVIVKFPQWFLALLAGDFQIWLGFLIDKRNIFGGTM